MNFTSSFILPPSSFLTASAFGRKRNGLQTDQSRRLRRGSTLPQRRGLGAQGRRRGTFQSVDGEDRPDGRGLRRRARRRLREGLNRRGLARLHLDGRGGVG